MLFVTMPKSASSALVKTIEACHSINDVTTQFRNEHFSTLQLAQDYVPLIKTHSDFLELDQQVIEDIVDCRNKILKYHFPPTTNNQSLLRSIPKVVLLREPEDIIYSYMRGDESGAFKMKDPDFAFCFSKKSWLRKAKSNGVYQSLVNFYNNWEQHDGNMFLIHYNDLVHDQVNTLNRVEEYFGIRYSNEEERKLYKVRYSRKKIKEHALHKYSRMLWSRRGVIKRKIIGK